MHMHKDNDTASAGGLAGFILLFIIVAAAILVLSPVVDSFMTLNNAVTPGMPVSQERMSTMALLAGGFGIIGIMILIAVGINYWIIAIRSQNQET